MKYEVLRYDKPIGKDGTDVTVRFIDATYGIDHTVTFWWEKGGKPTLTDMQDRLLHIGNNLIRKVQEEQLEAQKPSMVPRDEINELLIKKGYLNEGQDYTEIPSKADILLGVK